MASGTRLKPVLYTFVAVVVTIAGTYVGADFKTYQQVHKKETVQPEIPLDQQLERLQMQKSVLLRTRRDLQKKLKEIESLPS